MYQREPVFLDSSIIHGYLRGDLRAKDIVLNKQYIFYINDVVVNEVAFSILKSLYEDYYGKYKFYSLKDRVEELDAAILRGYDIVLEFIDRLISKGQLIYLMMTLDVVYTAFDIAKEYGLLPADALIAATCKHYGIETIATFDEDFKRIPWLKTIP